LTVQQLRELKNDFGETLLHFACLGGQLDIIEMLLSETYGFDINQRSALGWTPLLFALTPDARNHHDRIDDWNWKNPSNAVQAAHLLIERGANTQVVSDPGWTPLHILCLHVNTTTCHKGVYSLGLKLLEGDRNAVNAPAPKLVGDE
jgi:ankyrin repeat protein